MGKKKKKLLILVVVLLVLAFVVPFVTNLVIERKIINKIKDLPEHIMVQYTAIEADVVRGDLRLFSPYVVVKGKVTDEIILEADLEDLFITDLGYWDYLVNDNISLEEILIKKAVVKYKHNDKVEQQQYGSDLTERIKREINVKHIAFEDSDVLITNFETDSTILSLPKFNFEVDEFTLNPKNSKEANPYKYKEFSLKGNSLKWAMGDYENLKASNIALSKSSATLDNLVLKTKYTKEAYASILKVERDYFNLAIKKVQFSNLDFGFNVEDKFYFNSDKVSIIQPISEIYRDKLLPDDLSQKPLYGKMLRDMDFALRIDNISIENGELTYAERTKPDKKAGVLKFKDLDATIQNFGNVYGDTDTTIDVNSRFMEDSPLEVNWNFKVQDTTDRFVFKADLATLQAERMNQFTEPNLNVKLEGVLQQTYFTVSGNPYTSNIDLKVKYDDFRVAALKDNGKERKKLLSSLINLIISNDSNKSSDGFRYGDAEQVERNQSKSVFNFVWLNIKSGLLSAMAGDGEKDD